MIPLEQFEKIIEKTLPPPNIKWLPLNHFHMKCIIILFVI